MRKLVVVLSGSWLFVTINLQYRPATTRKMAATSKVLAELDLLDTSVKFLRSHPVPKCLDTVKCDHGNVIFVASQQLRIAFDIHFFKLVCCRAVGSANRLFSFVAEMAARSRVNNHLSFHGWFFLLQRQGTRQKFSVMNSSLEESLGEGRHKYRLPVNRETVINTATEPDHNI